MKHGTSIALLLVGVLVAGCAEMSSLGGPKYGETSGVTMSAADRNGKITAIEVVKVEEDIKLGVGTVVGAVAGGLLGSEIGSGRGSTAATVAGAAAGAAAGTVAESKLRKKDAQRVTVQMKSGGQVTILQPVDARLKNGLDVRVEGSGETARALPR